METYQLTRSKRKSLSILIGKDGVVQVKAPNWLPKYQIDQFIQEKADWIEKKRFEISMREKKKAVHTFQEGDSFLVLGETYHLAFRPQAECGGGRAAEEITLDQKEKLLVMASNVQEGTMAAGAQKQTGSIEASQVKKKLEEWYIQQAKQVFQERVAYYYPFAAQIALRFGEEIGAVNRIAIRSQKTRWGSCSSKRNLNFNWRLLMAPGEILDYVVVHELCHLAYLNHSMQFWQMVAYILPDCQERRNWLKANGMLLEWEGEP